MNKLTLTFDMSDYDNKMAGKQAVHATDAFLAIDDILSLLRNQAKYAELGEREDIYLEYLRGLVTEILEDRGIGDLL